jgi:hypothetical protein
MGSTKNFIHYGRFPGQDFNLELHKHEEGVLTPRSSRLVAAKKTTRVKQVLPYPLLHTPFASYQFIIIIEQPAIMFCVHLTLTASVRFRPPSEVTILKMLLRRLQVALQRTETCRAEELKKTRFIFLWFNKTTYIGFVYVLNVRWFTCIPSYRLTL